VGLIIKEDTSAEADNDVSVGECRCNRITSAVRHWLRLKHALKVCRQTKTNVSEYVELKTYD